MIQDTHVKGFGGQSEPKVGEALEDKKKTEEYPFRRKIEELISSPLGELKEGEMMEEGEIVGHHSLPSSPESLGGKGFQEKMATDCATQERVCTPLRMIKASPVEIVARVMENLEKAKKELSPTSPQEGDNGEWEV